MDDRTAMAILARDAPPGPETTQACDAIVERHFAAMIACAASVPGVRSGGKVEALEVAQDVVARLLVPRIARQYDPDSPLRPWLLQLVRNRACDLLRGEKRQGAWRQKRRSAATGGGSPLERAMLADEFATTVKNLTPQEEEICRLFYMNDLSAQEVAARLGRTVSWVYRNLYNARARLRALRSG